MTRALARRFWIPAIAAIAAAAAASVAFGLRTRTISIVPYRLVLHADGSSTLLVRRGPPRALSELERKPDPIWVHWDTSEVPASVHLDWAPAVVILSDDHALSKPSVSVFVADAAPDSPPAPSMTALIDWVHIQFGHRNARPGSDGPLTDVRIQLTE